jgi:hypothetical protein
MIHHALNLTSGSIFRFSFANEGDSITTFPITDYHHVGMQICLYKTDDEPVVTYPSETETWGGTFSRLWT